MAGGMAALGRLFAEHYEPRLPFTRELNKKPKRSLYYEIFPSTSTLTASVLLIFSLEYIAANSCFRCLLKLRSLANPAQFLILVVPFLICVLDYPQPFYASFVLQFDAFCCAICTACCLHRCFCHRRSRIRMPTEPLAAQGTEQSNRPPSNDCQTVYRSIVYLSTAVCIFARDQPCWRNDFSKADTFGTGLMDVGLGCFVICIGTLGPTATRARVEVNRSIAMKKAGAQFLLLAICGLVKSIFVAISIAIQQTIFDESWHEYGVHWNAFFSLAVAKLGGTALELFLLPDRMPPLLAGLLAGVGHEVVLARGGLAEYVLAPGKLEPHNRDSLFGANREGICSALGLATLYFVGLQLGRWTGTCARRLGSGADFGSQATALRRLVGRLAGLLAGCLVYRVLLGNLPELLLPESRRLLNLSYAAWIAAFSAYALASVALMLAARLFLDERLDYRGGSLAPIHLRQVDSAGLMYFLVANLLTGLSNPLITLAAPDRESIDGRPCFGLVLMYMVAVYPAARLAQQLLNVRTLIDRLTGCIGCTASVAMVFCRLTTCQKLRYKTSKRGFFI